MSESEFFKKLITYMHRDYLKARNLLNNTTNSWDILLNNQSLLNTVGIYLQTWQVDATLSVEGKSSNQFITVGYERSVYSICSTNDKEDNYVRGFWLRIALHSVSDEIYGWSIINGDDYIRYYTDIYEELGKRPRVQSVSFVMGDISNMCHGEISNLLNLLKKTTRN